MAETNPNGGVPTTSASTAPSADVSEASKSTETTNATDPMATAPEAPTEAQQDEAGVDEKNKEAIAEGRRLASEDAAWRAENPGKVRMREANPKVGGESFDYLKHVSA